MTSVCTDPCDNIWLASGSADRLIKLWDVAEGRLLLTLTGHVGTVKSLAASARHPYLFSAGDDKQVKQWDLTVNQATRSFHGHLHGCTSVKVHPALDLILSASRDGTAKLWDMRTARCIHTLAHGSDAVHSVAVNDADPQIATASADCRIKLWDIRSGTCTVTMTHHKKGVRALCFPRHEHTIGSAGGDSVKRYSLPTGRYLHDMERIDSISFYNTLDINAEGIAVGGTDDGCLSFWDWPSGKLINSVRAPVQPGSLECEAGILDVCFDQTGLRVFTGEVDKTIKVYKEVDLLDDGATSHAEM